MTSLYITEKYEVLLKKNSSEIDIEFCFIVNFPLRPELVFLSPFVY